MSWWASDYWPQINTDETRMKIFEVLPVRENPCSSVAKFFSEFVENRLRGFAARAGFAKLLNDCREFLDHFFAGRWVVHQPQYRDGDFFRLRFVLEELGNDLAIGQNIRYAEKSCAHHEAGGEVGGP